MGNCGRLLSFSPNFTCSICCSNATCEIHRSNDMASQYTRQTRTTASNSFQADKQSDARSVHWSGVIIQNSAWEMESIQCFQKPTISSF